MAHYYHICDLDKNSKHGRRICLVQPLKATPSPIHRAFMGAHASEVFRGLVLDLHHPPPHIRNQPRPAARALCIAGGGIALLRPCQDALQNGRHAKQVVDEVVIPILGQRDPSEFRPSWPSWRFS